MPCVGSNVPEPRHDSPTTKEIHYPSSLQLAGGTQQPPDPRRAGPEGRVRRPLHRPRGPRRPLRPRPRPPAHSVADDRRANGPHPCGRLPIPTRCPETGVSKSQRSADQPSLSFSPMQKRYLNSHALRIQVAWSVHLSASNTQFFSPSDCCTTSTPRPKPNIRTGAVGTHPPPHPNQKCFAPTLSSPTANRESVNIKTSEAGMAVVRGGHHHSPSLRSCPTPRKGFWCAGAWGRPQRGGHQRPNAAGVAGGRRPRHLPRLPKGPPRRPRQPRLRLAAPVACYPIYKNPVSSGRALPYV